jgi:hypothetical protein
VNEVNFTVRSLSARAEPDVPVPVAGVLLAAFVAERLKPFSFRYAIEQ